jgi:hypothetical protein
MLDRTQAYGLSIKRKIFGFTTRYGYKNLMWSDTTASI